ncbi:hypothetical protein B0H13DRAFT_1897253 [Mycena leptocephala]|nr:hypothetical protein B0H13DRAFT_1897253 [Mycena leptocephala]
MDVPGSGYIMVREERCEIETSSAQGARSRSSAGNLNQGVQVWSGSVGPVDGSWGMLAKIEREEGERGKEAGNQRSAAITVDRTSALTVVFRIHAPAQTGLEIGM